jgi:hypothetical protein
MTRTSPNTPKSTQTPRRVSIESKARDRLRAASEYLDDLDRRMDDEWERVKAAGKVTAAESEQWEARKAENARMRAEWERSAPTMGHLLTASELERIEMEEWDRVFHPTRL